MSLKLILTIVCASTLATQAVLLAEGHGTKSRPHAAKRVAKPKADCIHERKEHVKKSDPGVNARQEHQKDRIKQGIRSGQLTKEEAQQLKETQKEIRQEEKEYKSDGTLTKEERKDLHQDLNAASKEIYQEKHDAETQPGVTPAEPKPLGTKDPGVNQRQENQEDRIQQGVRSGELTKRETFTLAQKEKRLAHLEKRLKKDGSLTAAERTRLHKELNELSAEIYKQKHDAQDR